MKTPTRKEILIAGLVLEYLHQDHNAKDKFEVLGATEEEVLSALTNVLKFADEVTKHENHQTAKDIECWIGQIVEFNFVDTSTQSTRISHHKGVVIEDRGKSILVRFKLWDVDEDEPKVYETHINKLNANICAFDQESYNIIMQTEQEPIRKYYTEYYEN